MGKLFRWSPTSTHDPMGMRMYLCTDGIECGLWRSTFHFAQAEFLPLSRSEANHLRGYGYKRPFPIVKGKEFSLLPHQFHYGDSLEPCGSAVAVVRGGRSIIQPSCSTRGLFYLCATIEHDHSRRIWQLPSCVALSYVSHRSCQARSILTLQQPMQPVLADGRMLWKRPRLSSPS